MEGGSRRALRFTDMSSFEFVENNNFTIVKPDAHSVPLCASR